MVVGPHSASWHHAKWLGLHTLIDLPCQLAVRGDSGDQFFGEVWITTPASASFALEPPRPNPSRGELDVSFELPANAPATLAVLDLAGRVVESVQIAVGSAGSHILRLDDRGGVRAGLYFDCVRVTTPRSGESAWCNDIPVDIPGRAESRGLARPAILSNAAAMASRCHHRQPAPLRRRTWILASIPRGKFETRRSR